VAFLSKNALFTNGIIFALHLHNLQQNRNNAMQQYISNDKNIRDFVQNILRSGNWEIARHGKHVIIRHIAEMANKTIVVPSTPSDPRTFENFRRDYLRYLRQYLIQVGWIRNRLSSQKVSPLAA
jgi:hypothetical protein